MAAEDISTTAGGSIERVQQALAHAGLSAEIRHFDASTRTAADAAAAIGCTVDQIAKSVIFRGMSSGRAILVIASGSNRVDTAKVAAALGEDIGKADADFVRQRTGFSIGGVAPVGHSEACDILIDRDLMAFSDIWAAAGSPHAVFCLTPADLKQITGGRVVEVKA